MTKEETKRKREEERKQYQEEISQINNKLRKMEDIVSKLNQEKDTCKKLQVTKSWDNTQKAASNTPEKEQQRDTNAGNDPISIHKILLSTYKGCSACFKGPKKCTQIGKCEGKSIVDCPLVELYTNGTKSFIMYAVRLKVLLSKNTIPELDEVKRFFEEKGITEKFQKNGAKVEIECFPGTKTINDITFM